LLSALTAPALPEELAGERAAVAGFVRAQREAPADPPPRGYRTRRILGVLAVAVTVAVGAGTATAATNGALPRGLQEGAHRLLSPLGVPAPASTRPSGASSAGTAGSGGPQAASPGLAPDPSGTNALQLCQAWASEQKEERGRHTAADAVRDMLNRVGNSASVTKFCTDVLAAGHASPSPTGTPAPSDTPPATPADGKGHASPHPRASQDGSRG
jgi:hypothetical protein